MKVTVPVKPYTYRRGGKLVSVKAGKRTIELSPSEENKVRDHFNKLKQSGVPDAKAKQSAAALARSLAQTHVQEQIDKQHGAPGSGKRSDAPTPAVHGPDEARKQFAHLDAQGTHEHGAPGPAVPGRNPAHEANRNADRLEKAADASSGDRARELRVQAAKERNRAAQLDAEHKAQHEGKATVKPTRAPSKPRPIPQDEPPGSARTLDPDTAHQVEDALQKWAHQPEALNDVDAARLRNAGMIDRSGKLTPQAHDFLDQNGLDGPQRQGRGEPSIFDHVKKPTGANQRQSRRAGVRADVGNPTSPARSEKGNLRNFKAMKDEKLAALADQMSQRGNRSDREAVRAIRLEQKARGGRAGLTNQQKRKKALLLELGHSPESAHRTALSDTSVRRAHHLKMIGDRPTGDAAAMKSHAAAQVDKAKQRLRDKKRAQRGKVVSDGPQKGGSSIAPFAADITRHSNPNAPRERVTANSEQELKAKLAKKLGRKDVAVKVRARDGNRGRSSSSQPRGEGGTRNRRANAAAAASGSQPKSQPKGAPKQDRFDKRAIKLRSQIAELDQRSRDTADPRKRRRIDARIRRLEAKQEENTQAARAAREANMGASRLSSGETHRGAKKKAGDKTANPGGLVKHSSGKKRSRRRAK